MAWLRFWFSPLAEKKDERDANGSGPPYICEKTDKSARPSERPIEIDLNSIFGEVFIVDVG